MIREVIERAATLNALAQAGETPITRSILYDSDAASNLSGLGRPTLTDPFAANNMIWDNGGDDTINAGAGSDWMIAGRGADMYVGGSGFDVVAFVRANTGVKADLGDEFGIRLTGETNPGSFAFGDRFQGVEGLVGSRYDDTLHSFFERPSYLNGFAGNDILFGGLGADTIKGGAGDDTIFGHQGTGDRISGGAGEDTIFGGADSVLFGDRDGDSFVFELSFFAPDDNVVLFPLAEVVIADWNFGGAQDSIVFRGEEYEASMRSRQEGDDTVLTFDGIDGEIRVLDTTWSALRSAIDFE